jgi:hypothetical protein
MNEQSESSIIGMGFSGAWISDRGHSKNNTVHEQIFEGRSLYYLDERSGKRAVEKTSPNDGLNESIVISP